MLRGWCDVAIVAGAADERMMQLLRNMNRLLDKHPQSRRRHLAWHTPIIVPVYPQVCSLIPGKNLATVPAFRKKNMVCIRWMPDGAHKVALKRIVST